MPGDHIGDVIGDVHRSAFRTAPADFADETGEEPRTPMDMDLLNAAVGLKQAQNTSAIQMAVARKVMDADKMNGAAAIKLLNAATSGVAEKGDALAAAATGLGGEIDTYG